MISAADRRSPGGDVGVSKTRPDGHLTDVRQVTNQVSLVQPRLLPTRWQLEAKLGDIVVWDHRDRSRELKVLAVE